MNPSDLTGDHSALPEVPDGDALALFRAFGLVIAVPRRYLVNHCEMEASETGANITIDVSREPVRLDDPGWVPSIVLDDETQTQGRRLRARYDHGSGAATRYLLIADTVVECWPQAGILKIRVPERMPDDTIGAFITGAAMVFYFRACQRLCLHASVVARESRCVVFCGRSGIGKSSLAAALSVEGWQIVAEDMAVLEPFGGGVGVRPGYGRVRLWAESVDGMQLGGAARPIIAGARKHYVRHAGLPADITRLTHIVFLGERAESQDSAARVDSLKHAPSIVARLYQNSLVSYGNLPSEISILLRTCREIAATVPCGTLTLKEGYSHLRGTAKAMDRLLDQLES